MKIKKVWFENQRMYGQDADGKTYWQSVLWYRRLLGASAEQLSNYTLSFDGVHWEDLDEDIGFDSFIDRNEVEPTPLQAFFLTHREINLAEFAKMMGINTTLLRNYVYGWKIPSEERTKEIASAVRNYGEKLTAVTFV